MIEFFDPFLHLDTNVEFKACEIVTQQTYKFKLDSSQQEWYYGKKLCFDDINNSCFSLRDNEEHTNTETTDQFINRFIEYVNQRTTPNGYKICTTYY